MFKEPLSAETVSKIRKLLEKGLSGRAVAAKLGIGESTVRKYKETLPQEEQVVIDKAADAKVSVKGDEMTVNLPKTRIHKLEDLIEFCEVDTDVWETRDFVCNKWEVGAKVGSKHDKRLETIPLFQVKAIFRRRRHPETEGYIRENASLRSQLEKARVKVRIEQEMSRRLAKNHFGFDDFLENVTAVTKAIRGYEFPKTTISTLQQKAIPVLNADHSEDAVLLISDTHFGERIRKEDTSGFQEVNLEVQGNRIGQIVRAAKEVLTLHRSMYPIDTLHVWFGGDIGNGDLHSAALSNEINIIEQVHFSFVMLKQAVYDLLDLVDLGVVGTLNLLFTVGNHMRLDEKMPYKMQARRTFDWLIYQLLIEEFKGNQKVKINTDLAPYIFQNVRGHRYMFCHGMQVGYRNAPQQQAKSASQFLSLARALFDSRQFRKETGLEGETFTRVCIGDIHVPLSFPRIKSNGSISGQNELGVNWTLEPIPAGQQLFGVSDKHQETWSYFLDVTHIGKKDTNAYGEFAARYAKEHNA